MLNKADLAGFGAGGPIAVADRRAAEYQALTGARTLPMVGLLATATLDEELIGALRLLTAEPADLTSTDEFLSADHRLPRAVRARLLDTLDLFGIAHGVLALRQGADAAALPAVLRRLSQVDRVLAQLAATGAEVRYRRVRSALVQLRTLAARGRPALAEFLAGDEAVIAVMAAAVDVVQAAGLTVDPDDDRRRICTARCTGIAIAADPSTISIAAAAPISAGARCGCCGARSPARRPGDRSRPDE